MQTSWTHQSERYRYAVLEDLPSFVAMLSNPEVGRWLWFTPATKEMIDAFFTPYLESQTQQVVREELPKTAVFAVENSSGEFLGQGAAVAIDGSPGGYEIGFQLRQEAWGRGVGTRLSRFLCAYSLVVGDAFRIEGSCLEGNVASRALLAGIGLDLEGIRPSYRLKEEVRHTELQFGSEVSKLSLDSIRATAREVGLLPSEEPSRAS